MAILLLFVQYQHQQIIKEDYLLCECLVTNMSGTKIFSVQYL